MRDAHQGVPVAGLPGSSGDGLFSGLFGSVNPAPVQASAATPQVQANGSGSLDSWLINNLFGRRN
jgi:hypothetical protein